MDDVVYGGWFMSYPNMTCADVGVIDMKFVSNFDPADMPRPKMDTVIPEQILLALSPVRPRPRRITRAEIKKRYLRSVAETMMAALYAG